MEIGIDSFASAMYGNDELSSIDAMEQLLERIVAADEAGLDVFGIGEHHKKEFLDSVPAVILAAAAARTKNIRLMSAVTVLSTSNPVRVFQQFATLDIISKGRAEIIAGRSSATEAFPLFGYDLNDYDALFKEKLKLLIQIRDEEFVTCRANSDRHYITSRSIPARCKRSYLSGWELAVRRNHLFVPEC